MKGVLNEGKDVYLMKNENPKSKQLKFIYAGRLDHNKGIVEILNIFKNYAFYNNIDMDFFYP